jgi:predicted dehydrogenase
MLMECLKPLPVEKVAICGNPDYMEKIGRQYTCGNRYTDYREMLAREKPDVVLLFPEEGDVAAMARDCLKSGAYVFAERPVCQSTAEVTEMIRLQEQTGRYIMPRFTRRCAPSYQMAKEILGRAEFGSPDMFLVNYYAGPYGSEKAMIWSHFSHIVDAMVYLLGDMKLLHAEKTVRDEHKACYNMSFQTASGAIGVIQSGFTLCYEYPMEHIKITGDNRYLVIDNIRTLHYYRPAPERKYGGRMVLSDDGDTLSWSQNYGQMSLFSYYGFEGCLEEIVQAAIEKRPPSFHMEDAAKTIKLLEEIEKKAVLL